MNDMVVLNYNLGNACNLRCKFCYNDKEREYKQYYKTFDEVKKDLTDLLNKSIKIFFIGGEPLFHPDILKIIDLTRDLGFIQISIVSNGLKLADSTFAKELLSKKVDELIFSIHAHTSELDDKISDRKNVFSKRKKSLDNFHLYNKHTGIALNLVINTLNENYLNEIVGFYYNYGFKIINLYGMLQGNWMSETNISMVPNFNSIINNINKINQYNDLEIGLHWVPLCISSQALKIDFIREVSRKYIYNIGNTKQKLFDNQVKYKLKLDECRKCYAYGKFCFGVYNLYSKKYGINKYIK